MENIGKTIKALYGDTDRIVLEFEDGACTVLDPQGDCCSNSWFEHVQGINQVIGHTLLGAGDVEFPDGYNLVEAEEDHYDYIQYYGYEVRTDFGKLFIEYRNSSNGYYGGWVSTSTMNEVPANLVPLTEDF